MPFQPIGSILSRAIRKAGITEQVTAAQVLEETKKTLQRLWGEEKAAWIEPLSFREGLLRVRSLSAAATQEWKMTEIRILNEVNRVLGSRIVQRTSVATGTSSGAERL